MTDAEEPEVHVALPARRIAFPRSISATARANLAQFVDVQGVPLNRSVFPAADDVAGWAACREEDNQRMNEYVQPGRTPTATIELAGCCVHVATPPDVDQRVYLDIHGGGLVFGGGEACRRGASLVADQFGVRCYAVDYRTPPEHPYPAGLDDCVGVYRALLERHRATDIVIGGASAGGNLAAALVLRARDEDLPLPAALILRTPEVDLTESGDTFATNRWLDVVLPEPLMPVNLLYADGQDLAHPYLSPLFGDFGRGFPPTLLQSGTRDLFLSNTVRMHRALRRAGIPVELHVFEGMPHGGFFGAPEDVELSAEIVRFANEHWLAHRDA